MNTYEIEGKNVPSQGDRNPRDRRGAVAVPGSSLSSSNDGLSAPCTAGGVEENASAKAGDTAKYKPCPASIKKKREKASSSTRNSEASTSSYKGTPKDPRRSRVALTGRERSPVGGPEREDEEYASDSEIEDAHSDAEDKIIVVDESDTQTDWTEESASLDGTGNRSISRARKRKVIPKPAKQPEIPVKRGRGKPPTTGEYVGIRAEREALLALKQKELDLERERQLRGLSSEELFKKAKIDLDEMVDELKESPNADISSRGRCAADEVLRVTRISRNLQGGCVSRLKKAAVVAAAAVEVLRTRADQGGDADKDVARQLKALREELERTKEEAHKAKLDRDRLTKELDEMRATASKTSEEKRGRKRTTIIRDSSPSPEPSLERAEERGTPMEIEPSTSKDPGITEDCGMDGATHAGGNIVELQPPKDFVKVVLPPEEEWPPIRVPPLKGRPTIVENRPLTGHKVTLVTKGSRRKKKEGKPVRGAAATTPAPLNVQGIISQLAPLLESWLRGQLTAMGIGGERNSLSTIVHRENPKTTPVPSKKAGKKKVAAPSPSETNKAPNTGPVHEAMETDPPRPNPHPEAEWSKVLGRKEAMKKRKEGRKLSTLPTPPSQAGKTLPAKESTEKSKKPKANRRPPRTAAISLTCPEGQYTSVLKKAREEIDIEEIGIETLRPKWAASGALLFEIPGPDGENKATLLKGKLEKLFGNSEEIKVAKPTKMADICLKDIIDPSDKEEITRAISRSGECNPEEVRVGSSRKTASGLYLVWARCPLKAANKILESGRIRMGWTNARIEILPARTLRCYRCLEAGHVQSNCKATTDRSNNCYRCGQDGHKAAECENEPHCIVCAEAGKPAKHRLGGTACSANGPTSKKERTKAGKKTETSTSAQKRKALPSGKAKKTQTTGETSRPVTRGSVRAAVDGDKIPDRPAALENEERMEVEEPPSLDPGQWPEGSVGWEGPPPNQ